MYHTLKVLLDFVDAMNTTNTSSIIKPTLLLVVLLASMDVQHTVESVVHECIVAMGSQLAPDQIWANGFPALRICRRSSTGSTKDAMAYIMTNVAQRTAGAALLLRQRPSPSSCRLPTTSSRRCTRPRRSRRRLPPATLTRRGINGLMVHLDEKDDEIEQLKRDLDAALERLRDTERELENAQKGFEMVEQQIHTLGEDVDEDDRQVFEIIKRKAKKRVAAAEKAKNETEAMVKVLRTRSGRLVKQPDRL